MDENIPFWQFSKEIVWPRLLEGMGLTLELTGSSGFCAILIGLFLCLARISRHKWWGFLASIYITLFRGTPLLLQVLFIYFALPPLLDIRLEAMPAGILALSLNAGAYMAEIFRAAIQSIDRGQMEAARALGMGYGLAMRRVIFPQTLRRIIPPMVNEFATLAKDTSLVSVISLNETLYITQRLGARYLRPWEVYVWAAFGYLVIVVILTAGAAYIERRLARREV